MPKNIDPFLYELQIRPFIGETKLYGNESFTFRGQVSISFTTREFTNKIVLHSKNLEIKNYSISIANESISITQIYKDEKTDFLTFSTDLFLESGMNYTLKIEFNGIISNKLYGFYKSSYLNKAENKTY